jgi:hypothetical protein
MHSELADRNAIGSVRPVSSPIGFVLVTHTQPEQVALVCNRLSAMFADAPIAIHHDYSKCNLDPATLPPQVQIVKDWVVTAWGKSSVIAAYLAALRLLYRDASPDWVVSLSGADYPIQPARRIFADLSSTTADAWLDYREIFPRAAEPVDANSIATTFKTPQWMKSANERYVAFDLLPFRIRKHIGLTNRTLYLRNRWTTRFFTPFSESFRPYGGDAWHTINRRAASILLEDNDASLKLRHFYARRPSPEESYYHTILLNRPEIVVENDNRRFALWQAGAAHPRLLTASDVPAMIASSAHFARKFPFDPQLYRLVDQAVEAAPARSTDRPEMF